MVFDGGEGYTVAAAKRLQELPEDLKGDCQILYKTTSEAAQMAKATNPDVIFLNTPHGICLMNSLCVYLNSKAKGNALWNEQWMEYDVEVDMDKELAMAFLEHLQNDGVLAEGMSTFAVCEAPLRWAEVIPLWFFRDMTATGVKVVIFSNPTRRSQPLTLAEVAKQGQSIARFLNNLDQRVLYIVSGDLAHAHKTDCTLPLYLPDPRWNMPVSVKAIAFDLCFENWVRCTEYSEEDPTEPAKTTEKHSTVWDGTPGSSAEQWLSKAMNLKEVVVSCGIDGFGLLHGILSSELERKATYDAHLLSRLAPTYYGMAAAAFVKK
jgi:aromatic ring-opening dioxygenase LigB subunit